MNNVTLATIGHNSGIPAYSECRAQLADLRQMNDAAVFDYEDPKENKAARRHVYKLRQTKSAVEKVRKEEKAESLKYGRMVDEQAKEIVADIDKMIAVHAGPLEEIDQRERERVAKHEADLAEIANGGQQTTEQWSTLPLDAMRDRLAEIEAEAIGEDRWQEFALRAAQAKETAVGLLRDAIAKRLKYDAEQAELERLRAESEARAQAEREETIRKEAAELAAKDAERKAEQERARVEAEKAKAADDANRRELELRLSAESAERRRVEAEQHAARAAEEAEARLRREADEKAARAAHEAAKREADKNHRGTINRVAVKALVEGGIAELDAKQAVTLIAQGAVPNIQISY